MRKINHKLFRTKPTTAYARRMRRRYWVAATYSVGILMLAYLIPTVPQFILTYEPVSYLLIAFLPIQTMMKIYIMVLVLSKVLSYLAVIATLFVEHFLIIRPHMADWLAALGYCGSCFYPIAEITDDDDGFTLCPECGAAWRCHEKSPSPA
jgi:hypothetical protein